jgi:hypothetical protein
MVKLSTKWVISASTAQGSRGIIVAGQVGAVKIYVVAVERLRKKERQGEPQKTILSHGKSRGFAAISVIDGICFEIL